MKKTLFTIVLLSVSFTLYSQVVTPDDFKNYNLSKFDSNGDSKADYIESALTIKDIYGLDKNNSITRFSIVDAPKKTKEKIYLDVNSWFIHSFNNGNSVIQLNDKDAGVIIGKGYVENVAEHTSFTSNAFVHAYVIVRVDIKDEKLKITTTIQEYVLDMGTGILGAMNGDISTRRVQWLPKDCFPFNSKNYKKTTSKAFVNCHIWSLVIADKLAEAVLNGITGTEEEW